MTLPRTSSYSLTGCIVSIALASFLLLVSQPTACAQSTNEFVTGEYDVVLGRVVLQLSPWYGPDYSGWLYWTGALKGSNPPTQDVVTNAFLTSQEYGQNYNPSPDNTTFVITLYLNAFGWVVDQNDSGVQYWKGQLDAGVARKLVADAFIDSSTWYTRSIAQYCTDAEKPTTLSTTGDHLLGDPQSITITYPNSCGWSDVASGVVHVHAATGNQDCYIQWYSTGSASVVQGSGCTVSSPATIQASSNQVTLAVTFTTNTYDYVGSNNSVYSYQVSNEGASSAPETYLGTVSIYQPDFSISASSQIPTPVLVGAPATYTVSVTSLNNFSGTVTLSTSGLPSGASACFGTSPCTSTTGVYVSAGGTGYATMTVTATATGTSSFTVTGASGSLNHSAYPSLAAGDLSVTASALSSTVWPRNTNSATYTVTLTSQGGLGGSATLSASGLPAGLSASFNNNPITLNPNYPFYVNTTMTVTPNTSTPAGNYSVTVTATVAGGSRQTLSPPPFTVSTVSKPTVCYPVQINCNSSAAFWYLGGDYLGHPVGAIDGYEVTAELTAVGSDPNPVVQWSITYDAGGPQDVAETTDMNGTPVTTGNPILLKALGPSATQHTALVNNVHVTATYDGVASDTFPVFINTPQYVTTSIPSANYGRYCNLSGDCDCDAVGRRYQDGYVGYATEVDHSAYDILGYALSGITVHETLENELWGEPATLWTTNNPNITLPQPTTFAGSNWSNQYTFKDLQSICNLPACNPETDNCTDPMSSGANGMVESPATTAVTQTQKLWVGTSGTNTRPPQPQDYSGACVVDDYIVMYLDHAKLPSANLHIPPITYPSPPSMCNQGSGIQPF